MKNNDEYKNTLSRIEEVKMIIKRLSAHKYSGLISEYRKELSELEGKRKGIMTGGLVEKENDNGK